MQDKKRKKRIKKPKWWIIPIVLIILAAGIVAFSKYQFRITTVNISGSDKYTYDELYNYIFENHNDENMIFFKRSLKKNPMPDIPFIAKISVDIDWPGTINIEVYEKSMVGYIKYQGSYMYFDKDGVVVESSPELIDGIPMINGLKYNHIVLYDTLDVPDKSVFSSILDLKQYLEKYKIDVEEINVSTDMKFSVKIGNIKVLLGKDDSLMSEKIYELSCMMGEFGDRSGTLDMEEFSEDSKYVILTENK